MFSVKTSVLIVSLALSMYRKREAMLRKGKWIPTLIYLYLKLQKEKAAIESGLLESGDTPMQITHLLQCNAKRLLTV